MSSKQIVKLQFGMRLDENGREVLDPTPVTLPIGYKNPPNLMERMARLVKDQMSQAADAAGFETLEEANDFDVGDDAGDVFPDEDDEIVGNDPRILEEAHKAQERVKIADTEAAKKKRDKESKKVKKAVIVEDKADSEDSEDDSDQE